jgi:uncharacterized protein involved in exopolysaccharide biosynthesis
MGEIARYLEIIKKRWWVIALLCIVTVGTMLIMAFLTEPEYEAKVTVQVSAPPPQEAPLYSQFGRQALYDEIEQNRASLNELLVEGDVVRRALRNLPDIAVSADELLEEKLTVELPETSQLLHVKVRALDPETAALLANTMVEVSLQRYAELRAQPTTNTRQFIERQLETAQAELETAEVELAQFQIDNKIGGTLITAMANQYDLVRTLSIQRDVARAEGDLVKAQAVDEIILEHEADLQNMIGLSVDYNKLVDRVERARANADFLLDRMTEAQIKENQILELSYIQIITPARPPRTPLSVIDSKLIVLGAVGSILAGTLLVFLLEYLEVSAARSGTRRHYERSETAPLSENVN